VSVVTARAAAVPRPWVDRVLAAVPLASIYLWLCVLYGWEAWGHVTPWLNGDELETAQISRSIAETGDPARRGVAYPIHALYPYVLAPVWWIQDVGQAYGAAKYLNVLLMAAVVFPTYWLARMVVTKPWALFAAAGAGSIPALYYSSMLVEEPLAYPWAMLSAFLIAKALATRTRWWITGGGARVTDLSFRAGAAGRRACGVRRRRARARRDERAGETGVRALVQWDWVGGVTLAVGAVIAVNAAISHRSFAWLISTLYYKDRMLENGLWAVGALAVGIGVFPMIAGLAALVRPRGEAVDAGAARGDRDDGRAHRRVRVVHRREGRVHLDDVLDAGRRAEPHLRRAAALHRDGDVLRASARALVGRGRRDRVDAHRPSRRVPVQDGRARLLRCARLLAAPGREPRVCLDAGAGPPRARRDARALARRDRPAARPDARRSAMLAVVAVAVLGWSLAGQMSAASASNTFSEELSSDIARPFDWIDRDDRRRADALSRPAPDRLQRALADGVLEPLDQARLVDRRERPRPGPTLTPDLVNAQTGAITPPPTNVEYVVTDPGIDIVGTEVAQHAHFAAGTKTFWRLFKIDPPLRLQNSTRNVSQDGWAAKQSDYTQFTTPGDLPGFAVVRVHRKAWGGKDVPSKGDDPRREASSRSGQAAGARRSDGPLHVRRQPPRGPDVPAAHAAAALPRRRADREDVRPARGRSEPLGHA
jgi:hypothetical protein